MWVIASLFSAITYSLENIFTKKSGLHYNSFVITWALLIISSIFYIPLLVTAPIPHLNQTFWIAVALRLILDSTALVTYVKAIKMSDLSIAFPMLAFTPIFIMISSIYINHLTPPLVGIIGLCIILIGLYFLNFDQDSKHVLSPFKAIIKNKGVLLMFVSMVIWSVVASLRRLGIDNSNLYFYTPFFQIIWAILFTPFAYISSRKQFKSLFVKKSISLLLPLGILDGLQVFSYNAALKLTQPAYASAVRSLSILFTSFFAYYFFREKIHNKIIPTLIVLAGIILIALTNN